MISNRKKCGDDHPRARAVPLWLLAVVAGFLTVGIRQMLPPGRARIEAARPNPVVREPDTSRTAWAIAHLAHESDAINTGAGNSLPGYLGKLIQDLQTEASPGRREDLIHNFLDCLKAKDVPVVLEALKDAGPVDAVQELDRQLIRRWAEAGPQDVARWINNQPAGDQRQIALDNLAELWANGKLADAINWGQSLPDGAERSQTLAVVANEAVRTDPMVALQLAVNLPSGGQRDELIRRAAMDWASGDAPNAVAWAEQIPDETLRAKVLAGEAVACAKQDPESAAVLAVTRLPPGRLLEDTVISIVQRWAQQQPEAAGAWVAQFPKSPLRTTAIENLIIQWSQKDAAAARQWLAEHL